MNGGSRVDLERLLPWIMGIAAVLVWVGPMQWMNTATTQISDIPV